MPLVFVHGVSMRRDPGFDRWVAARDALFRRFLLPAVSDDPSRVRILNPYWGDHGARPAWNNASLPVDDDVPGEDLDLTATVAVAVPDEPGKAPLVATARRSVEEAVDLVWAAAAAHGGDLADLADLAERSIRYARATTDRGWLQDVESDEELLAELERRVEAWSGEDRSPLEVASEALGLTRTWDRFREAADRVRGTLGRITGRAVTRLVRNPAHHAASLFLGDILVYLRERGTREQPGPIVGEVIRALDQASRSASDPTLIVVAHSMGGNIAYDVLTHFRPDLEVDTLITVGSQVAFFEELKLFAESRPEIPRDPAVDRVARPANVGRWINVFDRTDVLAYAAEGVFSGVEDHEYSTGEGLFLAHMAYFTRPSFHDRLAEHVTSGG